MITMNLSRTNVENFPFNNLRQTWLISIANFGDTPANIKDGIFHKILFLHFDDIEILQDGFVRMNHNHLNEMVQFITEAKNQGVDLIVNCHAGVCRSGAIVEVLKLLGWTIDDNEFVNERIPNQFVFKQLCKAFGFIQSWEK